MDKPLKIILEAPELERERNYRIKANELILGPVFFDYYAFYRSEVKEEDGEMWEDRLVFTRCRYKKKELSGIELRYYRRPDVFGVALSFLGVADTWYTYYKEKKDAENFYKIIDQWWNSDVTN